MNDRGQTFVFLVVLIPVFLILAGVTVRSGQTLLVHQRIQNHCDQKILNALAEQAKGLALIGKLNPQAQRTIDARRKIEKALAAGMVAPHLVPAMISLDASLRGVQVAISAQQKLISTGASAGALEVLKKPSGDGPKTRERFTPSDLARPHRSQKALTLHIDNKPGYEKEIGAPKVLDNDFDSRQRIHGEIQIRLEKFLAWWPGSKTSPDIDVTCDARVEMQSLEDKWKVSLVTGMDKPSSKASWGSLSLSSSLH